MNNLTRPPLGVASLFRGLYNRVARDLGVNPSYVSRVARGERRSEAVQTALNREVKTTLSRIPRESFGLPNGKSRAAGRSSKKMQRS
jgi:hypothetical protein